MKTCLIVGAGGQDGRLLADLLSSQGCRVVGLGKSPLTIPGVNVLESTDILQADSVASMFARLQPDECYYLAAYHHSAEDAGLQAGDTFLFDQSFAVHVRGLVHCLEAMAKASPKTRLFYAASSHVFGSPSVQPQTEATPFNPENIYGITKAAGIHCCRYYRKERGVFAATGILYNHESHLRSASFLSQKIVRGVLAYKKNPGAKLVLGDLSATVDWSYAPDVVKAMTSIVSHSVPDDFVVASGIGHTVMDFLQAACEIVGVDWERCVTTKAGLLNKKPVTLIGDSSKLRRATGWKPEIAFSKMVRILVEHAQAESNS